MLNVSIKSVGKQRPIDENVGGVQECICLFLNAFADHW